MSQNRSYLPRFRFPPKSLRQICAKIFYLNLCISVQIKFFPSQFSHPLHISLTGHYLSANCLIDTVLFCEKYGIKTRALTSYNKIHKNLITANANDFPGFKQAQSEILTRPLSNITDLRIEFRTMLITLKYVQILAFLT